MAMLAFPLVISVLRPQPSRLSFCHRSRFRLRRHLRAAFRRRFAGTSVSAISTSAAPQHSSKDSNSDPQNPSVLTFQQAIQRLQVLFFHSSPTLRFNCFSKWTFTHTHTHMYVCVCMHIYACFYP